ncbi:hypothetical protein [Cocleimonas flava]|nr:hypothetical protein [Cocleimonas flava]
MTKTTKVINPEKILFRLFLYGLTFITFTPYKMKPGGRTPPD